LRAARRHSVHVAFGHAYLRGKMAQTISQGPLVRVDSEPWKPSHWKHQLPGPVPLRTVKDLLVEQGYEERIVAIARRALDDVPECANGKYSIRWLVPSGEPLLIVEFTDQAVRGRLADAVPAVAIALTLVRKGTLNDTLPDRKLLEGDRLRDCVLRSVHDYLERHGIKPSLDFDEGMRNADI